MAPPKKPENDADGIKAIPEILLPKVDVIFKTLFGSKRNSKILIGLLESILGKKIQEVELIDSKLRQETEDDKLSVLDVKAKLGDGEIVNIEMQVERFAEMKKRISFYSDGMIVEQLGSGGKYRDIKPAISIIIVAKSLIPESKKCHNVFKMLEVEEHFAFNDLQQIHILDLTRIDREENGVLSDWLRFINGEKKEDFMLVAERNEVIGAAFEELKVISSDENNRRLYEGRLKQQRDIWAREDDARREAKLEIAKNALDSGLGADVAAQITGLTIDDVLRLQQ